MKIKKFNESINSKLYKFILQSNYGNYFKNQYLLSEELIEDYFSLVEQYANVKINLCMNSINNEGEILTTL